MLPRNVGKIYYTREVHAGLTPAWTSLKFRVVGMVAASRGLSNLPQTSKPFRLVNRCCRS